jgi:uncharacterized metal-binding protein YceD (DUF177 family)
MKIVVEGIPSTGREVPVGLREEWARVAAAEAIDGPPSTLAGRIIVTKASAKGVVHVDLDVNARTTTVCDRCGEATERGAHPKVRLLYAPEEKGTEAYDGGELELEADDLDLGWYADGHLDLSDVLREALALALPTRTLCADSAECDRRTDLLLSTTRSTGGPFAALGGWKPPKGET